MQDLKTINYNDMEHCPFFNQKFDFLISTVESLKKILEKEERGKLFSENLNLEGAIKLLNLNGYALTRSSMYKLTSTNSIPFKRFGNRLVFVQSELLNWANSKITTQSNEEAILLSKVASRKLTKKLL